MTPRNRRRVRKWTLRASITINAAFALAIAAVIAGVWL